VASIIERIDLGGASNVMRVLISLTAAKPLAPSVIGPSLTPVLCVPSPRLSQALDPVQIKL